MGGRGAQRSEQRSRPPPPPDSNTSSHQHPPSHPPTQPPHHFPAPTAPLLPPTHQHRPAPTRKLMMLLRAGENSFANSRPGGVRKSCGGGGRGGGTGEGRRGDTGAGGWVGEGNIRAWNKQQGKGAAPAGDGGLCMQLDRQPASQPAAVLWLAWMHCMNIWSMAMQRALPPRTLPSA